jgi:hypothetical protein
MIVLVRPAQAGQFNRCSAKRIGSAAVSGAYDSRSARVSGDSSASRSFARVWMGPRPRAIEDRAALGAESLIRKTLLRSK